jgi:hypothetical protein
MKKYRNLRPSNAVSKSTTTTALAAPLVVWGLSALGVPLPPDPVAAAAVVGALSSFATGLLAYVLPGGRQGEAQ